MMPLTAFSSKFLSGLAVTPISLRCLIPFDGILDTGTFLIQFARSPDYLTVPSVTSPREARAHLLSVVFATLTVALAL